MSITISTQGLVLLESRHITNNNELKEILIPFEKKPQGKPEKCCKSIIIYGKFIPMGMKEYYPITMKILPSKKLVIKYPDLSRTGKFSYYWDDYFLLFSDENLGLEIVTGREDNDIYKYFGDFGEYGGEDLYFSFKAEIVEIYHVK